jgi:hypothetical protein
MVSIQHNYCVWILGRFSLSLAIGSAPHGAGNQSSISLDLTFDEVAAWTDLRVFQQAARA